MRLTKYACRGFAVLCPASIRRASTKPASAARRSTRSASHAPAVATLVELAQPTTFEDAKSS